MRRPQFSQSRNTGIWIGRRKFSGEFEESRCARDRQYHGVRTRRRSAWRTTGSRTAQDPVRWMRVSAVDHFRGSDDNEPGVHVPFLTTRETSSEAVADDQMLPVSFCPRRRW